MCFFIGVNILGIKEAGLLQRFLVFGLLGAILLYVSKGLPFIDVHRFVPFAPYGTKSIFATAGLVFISYGGLTKIASVAEEVKNPGRNIPLGMILSLLVAVSFYALAVFVTTGVLEPETLKNSLTPISKGAHIFMGRVGELLMASAAVLAFISTANAGIMSASRYPMAMSRDGVLPLIFRKVGRFKTPYYSIFFTGLFMLMAIFFLQIELLVTVASTFLLLLYIFSNLAVIIMRESKIQNYQPTFKAPLYPWIQLMGIVSGVFLIFEMGVGTYAITGIFIAISMAWYLLYVHPKVKKEFALIHVIERVTSKELASGERDLERELKEIVIERDEIIEDRFDRLISSCTILDLENAMELKDFFKKAADSLAPQLDMEAGIIYSLLMKREEESSTVIRPGLAIPHIVVEGEKKFRILLARCRDGVIFPHVDSKVNVIFVLAGTKDERNFHLRALAAIAEIAQAQDFDKHWLGARNVEELRDIVLLAERKRFLR